MPSSRPCVLKCFKMLDNGHVRISKVGTIRMFKHRPIKGDIKTMTVKKEHLHIPKKAGSRDLIGQGVHQGVLQRLLGLPFPQREIDHI